MGRMTVLLVLVAWLAGCSGGTRAGGLAPSAAGSSVARSQTTARGLAVAAAVPQGSVVAVLTAEGDRTFRASGFFVAPDRVVTCLHVVNGNGAATVQMCDGRQIPVRGVLAVDREQDLVLLSVATPTPAPTPLMIAPESPAIGETLRAVGCHLGRAASTSEVVVTRSEHRLPRLATAYHARGEIGPGSSGCPLLDAQGRVRGVVAEEDPSAAATGLVVPARFVLSLHAGPLEPMDRFGARTARDPEIHLRRSYEKALLCLRSGDYEGARRGAEKVYAEGRPRRSLYSRAAVDVLRDSLVRSGRRDEAAARLRAIAAENPGDPSLRTK